MGCARWPTPGWPPWCSRPCSRRKSQRETQQNVALAEAGTESFAESLSYFPSAADSRRDPPPLPEPGGAGRGRRGRAGHRQPERGHHRRVDGLRGRAAGRGRGRHRAEHLPPARRPDVVGPRRGAAARGDRDHGQGGGERAGRGEAQPLLQLPRGDGAAPGPGRRGRPGAVQPVHPARHRPGDAHGHRGLRAVPARPRGGCPGPGSPGSPAGSGPRSAPAPGSATQQTWPPTCWPARTW